MKNLAKFLIAFLIVVAAGTVFVTRGLDDARRSPRLLEHFGPFSHESVRASGTVVEERREIGDFTRVDLDGSGSVEIVLGGENAVTVSADRNLMPYVETEVKDGVLRLGVKPGIRFPGTRISYGVSAKTLEMIKASGSGDIKVKTPLASERLELRSEGSGNIRADVQAKKVTVHIAGSGDVDVGGAAEDLAVTILGSGSVKARDLAGRSAAVNVAGSGSVEVGMFETIEANIAGSGDVVYSGAPRVTSHVLGSGKLRSR
jgi:hypothetical protein